MKGQITEGKDVSGAALLTQTHGWLVSDETRSAQAFELDLAAKNLVVGASEDLLPSDGKEMDLEAAAVADGILYFTGSHGVSRKDHSIKPDRMLVARLQPGSPSVVSDRLAKLLLTHARLKHAVGRSLAEDGLDIEGLAAKDGNLYFGLRSPNLDGTAFIVEVPAAPFFTPDQPLQATVHELALGQGIGIRDLLALRSGFLLLTGPEAEGDQPFQLRTWPGQGLACQTVAEVPTNKKAKAEALLLLQDQPQELRLLILFDGEPNGAPRELILRRP